MEKKGFSEKFKNWPIKKKLVCSFGLIIVTTFVLIVTLLVGMKTIEGRLTKLYDGPTMNVYHSTELYYPQVDLLMCDKEAIEVQKILPFLSDTWPLCRIGRAVIRASQSCRQSCNKSQ
ncbi:MAG: hypothetical protein J6C33_03475, partial [Lachnospiraceae bacterium]|nr:hypothetical protein [Lachnospiraceae bacterium]